MTYSAGDRVWVKFRNEEKVATICSKWTNWVFETDNYDVTIDGENILVNVEEYDIIGLYEGDCECGSETDRHSYFCPKDKKR